MGYQVLALDLDGTLTNSKKEISEPTRKALIDIQEQGKIVILASGRATCGVMPLARQLRLQDYGGYVLSFNGGRITDCRTGSVIYNRYLPKGVVSPLFQIIKRYPGIDILSYTPDHIISGIFPNQYSRIESGVNHLPITVADDFVSAVEEPVNKFLVTGDPDGIQEVKKAVSQHFGTGLSVYCSDLYFLEIMPPGIDKAHSLLKLLSAIGLSADRMICCGDGDNDISMIETAGLGVAMANAQPDVRERADFVTKSNDEDGVLYVIDRFMR